MGGTPNSLSLPVIAAAILIALLLVAFLLGKLFHSNKTRKWLMIGAGALWLLMLIAFFGCIEFVLSGNIN